MGKGHGRVDDRYYYLAKLPKAFSERDRRAGLKAIGMAVRITLDSLGNETFDTRWYTASRYLSGKRFAAAVRGQCGSENSLHWQLDVMFGEDECRLCKDDSPGLSDGVMSAARTAKRWPAI